MIIKSKTWQFLKDDIKKNLPSFVSTFGYFERTFKYQIRDLDWNHMDALHRPIFMNLLEYILIKIISFHIPELANSLLLFLFMM